jgi:hypothetical protein
MLDLWKTTEQETYIKWCKWFRHEGMEYSLINTRHFTFLIHYYFMFQCKIKCKVQSIVKVFSAVAQILEPLSKLKRGIFWIMSHTWTLISCSDVTTIVGLSLTSLFSFCGVGITEQRKWKWEGGGTEKLAWGIGRATKNTFKSDVDPSGNILFWSDPLLGGLS